MTNRPTAPGPAVEPVPTGVAVGPARTAVLRRHGYVVYLAWLGLILAISAMTGAAGLVLLLAVLACPVAIVVGVRLHRPRRPAPWIALATGVALFALGDMLWIVAGPFESPTGVDLVYVGGYAGIATALAIVARRRRAPLSLLIDAAVIGGSAAAIFALSAAWPIVTDRPEFSPTVAALAYPIGSAVLFTAAIGLALADGIRRASTVLLCGGLLALLAADTVYAAETMAGMYAPEGTLLVLWAIAYAGLGALALHPSMVDFDRRTSRHVGVLSKRRFILLVVATLAVPATDLVRPLEPRWMASAAFAVLLVLVALRVSGVVRALDAAASRDALTGLPNRSVLDDEFERVLAAPDNDVPGRHRLVVLFCDLDNFKVVNDGLGHSVGDRLLVAVAQRLRETVRAGDLVARLGGDEFVVLLFDVDDGEVAEVVDRILAAVSTTMTLADGAEVQPSLSIGVKVAAPGATAEDLLRDADAAMYEAKSLGRARAAHFTPVLHTRALDRLHVEGALRNALERDELFCRYQPEITIADGQLFGVEALARWDHPARGVLSPDAFIGVAEATGAIDAVFRRILRVAATEHARLKRRIGTTAVAVNLSARQLRDTSLPRVVAREMAAHGIGPGELWLEVTETALVAEDSTSVRLLHELHAMGVLLAIDDFGTGWSTLSRLTTCPWDALKIDRQFIADLHEPSTRAIVTAMVAMADALGLLTIAEGVETAAQYELLGEMGCDVAQGYLFARPTTVDQIADKIAPDGSWLDVRGELVRR